MDTRIFSALLIMPLVIACSASGTGSAIGEAGLQLTYTDPAQQPIAVSEATQADPREKNNEFAALIAGNAKIVASKTGDLNRDGTQDVLLVTNPSIDGSPRADSPRSLLLFVRDANGQLHKAAQNNKIIPCAKCGGTFGDPFGYTSINNGMFTVGVEGGSREHWWREYSFIYVAESMEWLIHELKQGEMDSVTGFKKEQTLSVKEIGSITLNNFDPTTLSKATLP